MEKKKNIRLETERKKTARLSGSKASGSDQLTWANNYGEKYPSKQLTVKRQIPHVDFRNH